ncbi:hypothetical protein A7982_12470 [Minicystis rosea]|nr:hypothetical protein A7982_12470 [Minicystis rosea]
MASLQILLGQLAPWTTLVPPQAELGGRFSSKKDVFEPGGFRLTWVLDPADERVLGRLEYVFRESSLEAVAERFTAAAARLGIDVSREIDDVLAKARALPGDRTELSLADRLMTTLLARDEWRGFVKVYAEDDLWMNELCLFRPAFRAARDS